MFATVWRVLRLGRRHLSGFVWVALLVSLSAAISLLEPWVYRAIVDDVASVFVAPPPVRRIESVAEHIGQSGQHLERSAGRIFHAPLREMRRRDVGKRKLQPRSPSEAVATIVVGIVLLLIARVFSELLKVKGDNRLAVLSNDVEAGFILSTFRHVTRLPLEFFTRRATGALAKQIDQSDQITPIFTAAAQEVWPDLIQLIAIIVIVSTLNRELALVTLLGVPAYALVSWRASKKLETKLDEYYGLWDEVSGRIQETLGGIKTVLACGSADWEYERLQRANRRALTALAERNRMENRYGFAQEMIVLVTRAAALLLGGVKALQHQLTPGDIVLFLAYLDRIFAPIENLTGLYATLQEHVGSIRRAEKLLALPEAEGEERPAFKPGGGEIEFRNVKFGYRLNRLVLRDVSFRIPAGQHVALVGPSGAGKTTLTDLLFGLYSPQEGEILVDGQRLADISPTSVRRAIRGVAVDGALFQAKIADNIRYGRLEASDAEVDEAARLAGLAPLLERLPDGLATEVGERGAELSAGERQRVLLARTFLSRPTILVLDEATANLDFRTEASVKEAMGVISHGRTTIVISHRRSMLTDVDRVLVLKGGTIEEDGPPSELLAKPGYFCDMMGGPERG